MKKKLVLLTDFAALALLLLLTGIIYNAPLIVGQSVVFKIFYIHLPLAWSTFLAVTVGFICNLVYLYRNKPEFSDVAESSIKIAFAFCSCVIITGSIWGKLTWGVWWSWDARLTSTLILWISLGTYLLLPQLITDQTYRKKLQSALSTFSFINIPLIHLSVKWWRTLHPQAMILSSQGLGAGVSREILLSIISSLIMTTLLYVYLMVRPRTRK